MKKGFTLIELLIVVAIIGILAAIAVPNFLNAQTRARIARCYADMKSMNTAVQQVQLDTNHLPIDGWDDDQPSGRKILKEVFNGVGDFPEAERKTSHYLAVLTSPVSYMSSVPIDPFITNIKSSAEYGFGSAYDTYIYADVDPHITENPDNNGIQCLNPGALADAFGITPLRMNEWAFIGVGPDGVSGIGTGSGAFDSRGFPYDPSNGLISLGDVVFSSGTVLK